MPNGRVEWFDPVIGEGRIVHSGRRYTVRAEDMHPKARVSGARVHFDVARGLGDRAINVAFRAGTRMNWHHRRFGNLSGTSAPDTAGAAPSMTKQTSLGRDLERHPIWVAELWADLLASADVENLIRLYAPDASLHAGGDVFVGPTQIRRFWRASPLSGASRASAIGDQDSVVLLRWPAEQGGPAIGSRISIAHGEVTEQWLGELAEFLVTPEGGDSTPLVLSSSGDIANSEWNYAIDKIGNLIESLDEPVLFASVRLDRSADRSLARGSMARVTVDLNGEPVRAHVSAAGMLEAIDLLESRLRERLRHLAEHRQAVRRRGPTSGAGSWRHGDPGTPRPSFFPRPVADRELVRHKTYTTAEATVDEAVFDMESMDYDFFLFTDLASGQDALVWRDGDRHRLQLLDGSDDPVDRPSAVAVDLEPGPAATLSVDDARQYLDLAEMPWVFFKDSETGRGRVLYHRYDGHYGLITPADEPA
jgi:ribosome-associated translation inhibitor RaiA